MRRTSILIPVSLLSLLLACGKDEGEKKPKDKAAAAAADTGTHSGHESGGDCPKALSLHDCGTPNVVTEEQKKEFPDPVVATGCAAKGKTTLDSDVTETKTLSGEITVTKSIKIAKAVVVTADDCASFKLAKDATISVEGTFHVKGKADAAVAFDALTADGKWGGIKVKANGKASLERAFLKGATHGLGCEAGALQCDLLGTTIKGIKQPASFAAPGKVTDSTIVDLEDKGFKILGGGDVTISNSTLYLSTADVLAQYGGKLKVTKSRLGGTGYAHCAIHIEKADAVEIRDSIISANAYAVMLGGVTGAVFANNNIVESKEAHFLKIGEVKDTKLSGNYWDGQGVPQSFVTATAGANTDVTDAKSQPISGVGPSTATP